MSSAPLRIADTQTGQDPVLTKKVFERRTPAERFPWLPCQLSIELPIKRFTVGDLVNLSTGMILETAVHHTRNLPLRVNGQLIAWTEFEVVADKIAVRITELV